MQSCCFFPRPFHESFKFLKNCLYDFHIILHRHSTPKGAPACAKASKSYDWNARNIATISPKMAKVRPKTEIFYSHSISYYGPLCASSLNSYFWHVRNIAKINQKWPINRHFSIFSKTVHTIRTKISKVIFYTIVWSYVSNFDKFV